MALLLTKMLVHYFEMPGCKECDSFLTYVYGITVISLGFFCMWGLFIPIHALTCLSFKAGKKFQNYVEHFFVTIWTSIFGIIIMNFVLAFIFILRRFV